MAKPCDAPANWIGEGLLIRPGLTPLGAKTKLYEAGFELLGTGACAAAFRLPGSDRCMKLVCDRTGHRTAVQMFRDHPEVESFPRIYGYAELTRDCFIYETELLEESDSGWDHTAQGDPDVIDWDCLAASYGSDAADFMEQYAENGADGWDTLYVDLHDENYMQRADGEIVVVDPFHRNATVDATGRVHVREGRLSPTSRVSDTNYWDNVKWRARQRTEVPAHA